MFFPREMNLQERARRRTFAASMRASAEMSSLSALDATAPFPARTTSCRIGISEATVALNADSNGTIWSRAMRSSSSRSAWTFASSARSRVLLLDRVGSGVLACLVEGFAGDDDPQGEQDYADPERPEAEHVGDDGACCATDGRDRLCEV
jgi:hypothetical protein